MLKKYVTTLVMVTMLGLMLPFSAVNASAQTRHHHYSSRYRTYRVYKRPNVYRRHRKAFNIGIGTGVGMLIGGLIGGGKGAVIGGLAGAGGGAYFTHKQRPKHYTRRYTYRYRRP